MTEHDIEHPEDEPPLLGTTDPEPPRLCEDIAAPYPDCGAIYTSNALGGQDICSRPAGHTGAHSWRREVTR